MRALLIVVVVACGGGGTPPAQAPVANTTPVTAPQPPVEPESSCGCTTEACHAADEPKYASARLCTYRDRMCACKDKACADATNQDFTHWMEDMAKSATNTPRKMTEADAKQLADTATQYQACYTKLLEP